MARGAGDHLAIRARVHNDASLHHEHTAAARAGRSRKMHERDRFGVWLVIVRPLLKMVDMHHSRWRRWAERRDRGIRRHTYGGHSSPVIVNGHRPVNYIAWTSNHKKTNQVILTYIPAPHWISPV